MPPASQRSVAAHSASVRHLVRGRRDGLAVGAADGRAVGAAVGSTAWTQPGLWRRNCWGDFLLPAAQYAIVSFLQRALVGPYAEHACASEHGDPQPAANRPALAQRLHAPLSHAQPHSSRPHACFGQPRLSSRTTASATNEQPGGALHGGFSGHGDGLAVGAADGRAVGVTHVNFSHGWRVQRTLAAFLHAWPFGHAFGSSQLTATHFLRSASQAWPRAHSGGDVGAAVGHRGLPRLQEPSVWQYSKTTEL